MSENPPPDITPNRAAPDSDSRLTESPSPPCHAEGAYPVIDSGFGSGIIYGYARTREEAIDVANASLVDDVVTVNLSSNVALRDGSTVEKAWVALTGACCGCM